jgi:acyl-CoA synthetase (AMP-forming)/AMP-acid ligase II
VVMSGYWDNPDATAATLVGGWLHTGDIGHLDGGYLHLTDRAKDIIITGGSNCYPREVEEVLLTYPAVWEAAVIGVPTPSGRVRTGVRRRRWQPCRRRGDPVLSRPLIIQLCTDPSGEVHRNRAQRFAFT